MHARARTHTIKYSSTLLLVTIISIHSITHEATKEPEERRDDMTVSKVARSISFPAPKLPATATAAGAVSRKKKTSYRTRSTSLPTRLHPLAAHIDAELDAIHSWSASPAPAPASPSAPWLAQGFRRLHLLLAALSDLLLLPQAPDPLRRLHRRRQSFSSSSFADRLLDDLLRLADAHAAFRSAALDLRHHLSSALSALRRPSSSDARLAAAARSRRHAERDVARAASSARDVRRRLLRVLHSADADEVEVAVVVREAMAAAATTSAVLFAGVASMSATAMAQPAQASWGWAEAALRWGARAKARALQKKAKSAACTQDDEAAKKSPETEGGGGGQKKDKEWRETAMERVAALEESVRMAEDGSEQVFRDLINTRVTLLNILTPTF